MTHPNKRDVHAVSYEFNEKRKVANQEIMRRLAVYLASNPSMRFSQALSNLNLVLDSLQGDHVWIDDYYLEPTELLKRMG